MDHREEEAELSKWWAEAFGLLSIGITLSVIAYLLVDWTSW